MHPFYSELPAKSYRYAAPVRALKLVIKRKWQGFIWSLLTAVEEKEIHTLLRLTFLPTNSQVIDKNPFSSQETSSYSKSNVLCVIGNAWGSWTPCLHSVLACAQMQQCHMSYSRRSQVLFACGPLEVNGKTCVLPAESKIRSTSWCSPEHTLKLQYFSWHSSKGSGAQHEFIAFILKKVTRMT